MPLTSMREYEHEVQALLTAAKQPCDCPSGLNRNQHDMRHRDIYAGVEGVGRYDAVPWPILGTLRPRSWWRQLGAALGELVSDFFNNKGLWERDDYNGGWM